MVTTRLYTNGSLELEDFPVAEISDHIAIAGSTVWADFVSPTEADLAHIAEELGLHPLAVEDAVHEHQRSKIDRYDTHLFLAAYSVRFDVDTGEVSKTEVKAFITPHAIVTVHDEAFDMDDVVRRWNNDQSLSKYGTAFLLWGLLDSVVDGHFRAVQELDAEIDQLEDRLFDESSKSIDVQRRSFELRKSLVLLRRAILPMREVVNTLMRRDLESLDQAMFPYFQDVYDHVLRAAEWTDSLRDLVSTILDTNVSIQGNRMNLIMKKVTSWAAIIAVPTAITGFFGQNLEFPGFGTSWGAIFSVVLIGVASLALYFSFKQRDWL
jgi:magnesium transporter